jgi:hypothetical protein
MDVKTVCLPKMAHHLFGSDRPPNLKFTVSTRTDEPSAKPEIRESDCMVGMQVGEENRVDVLPPDFGLRQPLEGAPARIK